MSNIDLDILRRLVAGDRPNSPKIHWNGCPDFLVERSRRDGMGVLVKGGALSVNTGEHTGRSPRDKYIVDTLGVADKIWWCNNRKMSAGNFARLYKDLLDHLQGRELFVQDLYACADPAQRLNVRMINSLAWHSLFIRHLLRRPARSELAGFSPEFTVLCCPDFKASPETHGTRSETVIAINFERQLVIIGGTGYSGENKKSIFTVANYLLPLRGVLPMHCAANHALGDPADSALFFGLSGTGKTTLSSDPQRVLIGDDEHGWSATGIFNIEGGCYAKTYELDGEAEPEIFAATAKFGTVVENMAHDPATRELLFNVKTNTENTRCAYPLDYVSNASETGMAGPPRNIFMLTCDAFGVLPPIARLTASQAMHHFLSGFTSKVGGTELGVTEPQPVFSACFGQPFLPLRPELYARLLKKRIEESGAKCWLVNTGWTGGRYGSGKRMPIRYTRALLTAALSGQIPEHKYRTDPNFGIRVPHAVEGVPAMVLDPKKTWNDPAEYDRAAVELKGLFAGNSCGNGVEARMAALNETTGLQGAAGGPAFRTG